MTDEAKEGWQRAYHELTKDKDGLLGAITARSEAQTIRLATIYALLDSKTKIDVDHLKAGLAVWEYCEASAARIFGGVVGDEVADEILGAIKAAGGKGLSKTEIHTLLGRHKSAECIDAALTLLMNAGLTGNEVRSSGAKPVRVWVANMRRANSANDDQL